jgi:DNA-binding phage protein
VTKPKGNLTTPYDAADYLRDERDMVAYLEAAFEDGAPCVVAAAQENIARARARIAEEGKA